MNKKWVKPSTIIILNMNYRYIRMPVYTQHTPCIFHIPSLAV